jgi:hypothetical protein
VVVADAAFFKGGETFIGGRPGAGRQAQKDNTRQYVFRAHDVPRPGAASLSRGVRALAGGVLCLFGRYLNKISRLRKNRMRRNQQF